MTPKDNINNINTESNTSHCVKDSVIENNSASSVLISNVNHADASLNNYQKELSMITKCLRYLDNYKRFREIHHKKYETKALEEEIKRQITKPLSDCYYDIMLLNEKLYARDEFIKELRQHRLSAIASARGQLSQGHNKKGQIASLPLECIEMEQINLEDRIFKLTDVNIQYEKDLNLLKEEVKKLTDLNANLILKTQNALHANELMEFKRKDDVRRLEGKLIKLKDQIKIKDEKIEKQGLAVVSLTKEVGKVLDAKKQAESETTEYKDKMERVENIASINKKKLTDLENLLEQKNIEIMTWRGKYLMLEESQSDLRRR